MEQKDKTKLFDMLFDLCSLQDTITHENEAGRDITSLREERWALAEGIVRFVESIE